MSAAVSVVNENTPLLPVATPPQPSLLQQQPKREISTATFRVILGCLYANVFLAAVDSTMVATLLGRIASDLDAQEGVSWVATSYLLSCAAFQPLFGKISDVFGRKPVILFSCTCFLVGCFLSGIGADAGLRWVVIGRLITGIGGGGFFAMATITVSDLVDTRARGLYQGYVNIFFHAGSAGGGILGGVIDAWLGWKWAFLLQVPICAMTGAAVYFWFDLDDNRNDKDDASTHWAKFAALDWTGAGLLVTALLALMIITGTSSDELPPFSPLWISLGIYSIIAFTGFYFWEQRVDEPVIPITLLHDRTVLASSLNCWFVCMNMFASLFYLPFYWTSVKNVSPLGCGYRMIAGSIVASFTSVFVGWTIKRTSKYRRQHLYCAAAIVIGSCAVYASTSTNGWLTDAIIALPLRYGCSADITITLVAMLSAVPVTQQALVTSIQYGFRSTGSTMGVSAANALMQKVLRMTLDSRLHKVDIPGWDKAALKAVRTRALEDPRYAFTEGVPSQVADAVIGAYDRACHSVFAFLIATGVCAMVCIYFTQENDLDKPIEENK